MLSIVKQYKLLFESLIILNFGEGNNEIIDRGEENKENAKKDSESLPEGLDDMIFLGKVNKEATKLINEYSTLNAQIDHKSSVLQKADYIDPSVDIEDTAMHELSSEAKEKAISEIQKTNGFSREYAEKIVDVSSSKMRVNSNNVDQSGKNQIKSDREIADNISESDWE